MNTQVYKSSIMTIEKNFLPRRSLARKKKIIYREKRKTDTK